MSYSHNKKRKFIKWIKREMGKKWLSVYKDCFRAREAKP